MKRPLIFTSALVGTIILAIQTVINVYSFFALFVLLGLANVADNTNTVFIVFALFLAVLIMACIITTLILNCCIFSAGNADFEKYNKKKGVIVATIVFDFILAFLLLISSFVSESALGIVVNGISLLLLVMCAIFCIVDLAKERQRKESEMSDSNTEENME